MKKNSFSKGIHFALNLKILLTNLYEMCYNIQK